jgi:anti-sigma B factor antagonist
MTIESERTGKSSLTMTLSGGRLDTATAPQLERKIKQWGDEITHLTLDFAGLSYMSSMGIRVLLQALRAKTALGGNLMVKNVPPAIREVFEMTGLVKLLAAEEKFAIIRKDEGEAVRLSLIGRIEGKEPLLSKEFSQLRETRQAREKPVLLILDMEQLRALSPPGCRALREALGENAWEHRTLRIEKFREEFRPLLQKEELGNFLA